MYRKSIRLNSAQRNRQLHGFHEVRGTNACTVLDPKVLQELSERAESIKTERRAKKAKLRQLRKSLISRPPANPRNHSRTAPAGRSIFAKGVA